MKSPLDHNHSNYLEAVLFGIAAVMTVSLAAMGRVCWCIGLSSRGDS